VSEGASPEPTPRLVEFTPLAGRLRAVAAWLAVVTLLAIVVDGMVRGLSFGVMVLWLSLFLAGLLVAVAVLVALHALRGAGAAQRRGERLAGDDVGLLPRGRSPRDAP
jgi:hypothetical protein